MLTKRKKIITAAASIFALLFGFSVLAADFIWPNLDLSVTATDYWGYTGGGSVHAYGQTFVSSTKNVHSVAFKLNRQCNDSCVTTNNRQLTLDILTGATCSSGTVAATYTLSATAVIAAYPYHTDSTYAIPIYGDLTPGDTYCARLTVSTYTGGTFMGIEDVNDLYSHGAARRSNSSDVWSDVSGLDAWFQLSGEYAHTFTPEITATISSPGPYDLLRTSDLSDGLPVAGYSSVESASDTGNATTFDWLISGAGVDWAEIDSATSNTLHGTARASLETFDAFDGPAGQYQLFLRACYDGACSPIASTFLNVADVATSTGITGGTTNPIVTTTDPFPTADYGSCGTLNLGDCFSGFFGWIGNVLRWLITPPNVAAFDPSSLFTLFETRWPFAYIFGPITTWQAGYATGTTCPIPLLLGNTIMGHTMPTFDLCATLAGIGTAIDANAFGYTTIVWAIYLGALFMAWRSAEGIHKAHKK